MGPADVAHQADGDKASTAEVSGSAVRWDKFLPTMVVRVLLVEADDSTRQIITALLRKCSYRVAAVADGLKAWELLKGRPHNIDLILTEVELPLISGYALLSLIMEHDVCKSIPVIMMSTNDSMSTVYKCMLRGAADFLVKPVRKNELRNLWQHVWRKQASNSAAAAPGGPGPPDESVAQPKVEATAENNAASSNQSSGFIACVQRNRECIEKGSDAQSSCTKPEVENDEAVADVIISDDVNITRQDLCHQQSREMLAQTNGAEGPRAVEGDNAIVKSFEDHQVHESSCREAIDLIGAFDANNCAKGVLKRPASNDSTCKFDISRQLDLSLRRSHPSVNQANEENRRLNHSIASAFSRYVNRPFHPGSSTSPSTQNNQNRDCETDSGKQLSSRAPDDLPKADIAFSYLNQRDISQPIPVRGLRLENVINGYGSLPPGIYRSVSGSPLPSPGPLNPSKSSPRMSKLYNHMDQRISANEYVDQMHNGQGQHLVNDHRGDSSGYYGRDMSHYHSTSSATNVNEGGNEQGGLSHVHEGASPHSNRSIQREAALTKFRMKRKERCFEKKVRYESRKKLAEQRPRIKGQFVRQVPNDGNSSAG